MKRTPLKRRVGLKQMSPKREAKRGMRSIAVDLALTRDKGCVGKTLIPLHECEGPLQGHETLPRARGGDPYDPDQIVMVCASGHRWIHDHPKLATELGLLRSGYTTN